MPDSAEARFLFGSALLAGGNAPAALVELRKARDLNYAEVQLVPVLAQAMLENSQFKKVVDEFARTVMPSSEAQASLKATLAAAYAALGLLEQTEVALHESLAAQPDNLEAQLLQARLRAFSILALA